MQTNFCRLHLCCISPTLCCNNAGSDHLWRRRTNKVEKSPYGYRVTSNAGAWHTKCVVVATGACQVPHRPTIAAALAPSIVQIAPREITASPATCRRAEFWWSAASATDATRGGDQRFGPSGDNGCRGSQPTPPPLSRTGHFWLPVGFSISRVNCRRPKAGPALQRNSSAAPNTAISTLAPSNAGACA